MPNITDYVFNNTPAHLSPLEQFLDPITRAEIAAAGVAPGARCLDLAAGAGSITRALAELAGPEGRVYAVDQDTHMLTPGPNVEVHTQDLSTDEPLPVPGPFDLIHARLLTHHLPNRREFVQRLAGQLAPGGALILGEFVRTPPRVLSAGSEEDAEIFRRVVDTLFTVLATRVDVMWGNDIHATMLEAGLTSVHTLWHAESWVGGEAGCLLSANNVSQKREELIGAGIAPEEVDHYTGKLMYDPALVVRSYEFCTVRGRRPA